MRSYFAIVVALSCAVLPARAHVLLPTEFREVVSDASLIVRGRVTDVRSVAVPAGGIDSIATVAVETVLKGHADSFIYVRVPGGELGRSRIVVSGAPTFRNGQRAVFFLRPSAHDSSHRPIGLTLGVYSVKPNPGDGRPVVEPPLVRGLTTPMLGSVTRGDTRRRLMPIQEFENLIRLVIASPPRQAIPRRGGR
jgi:hypothetical protein